MEWFIIIVIVLVIALCVYSGEQTDSDASTVNVKKQSSNVTTPNSSPCSHLITDEGVDEVLKSPDKIFFEVVGIFYRGEDAEDEALGLKAGEKIKLVKEPHNEYDKYALKVYSDNVWIGYVDHPNNKKIFNDMEQDESRATVLGHTIDYGYDDKEIIQLQAYYVIPEYELKEQRKREERNARQRARRAAKKIESKKITMTNKDFPEISCRFRDLFLSLPSVKNSGSPLRGASVNAQRYFSGLFYCPTANHIGCLLVN